MIVKEQKEIELINDCNAILREELLKAAILWYTDKPVTRLKKVFMHGQYPAISIHGKKMHVHRLLMLHTVKERNLKGWYVHHRNGNKLDNRPENLVIMSASEHQSITNKGRKQTPEWIKKRISRVADAKRGKKYPKKIYENPELLTK